MYHKTNDYSESETGWGLLSLPAPLFCWVGIGYSVFSHGNLKSPPPLNLGSENVRADATNQGMGSTRANHNSTVSSRCYTTWST